MLIASYDALLPSAELKLGANSFGSGAMVLLNMINIISKKIK
jgi:hypothetical protein